MKIAIFKEQLDPYSGFTRHIFEVSRRLVTLYNYRLILITSRILQDAMWSSGIDIHVVGGHPFWYTRTRRREILKILRDGQPDLLDFHGGPGTFLCSADFAWPTAYTMHSNKFSLSDYRTVRLIDALREGRHLLGPAYLLNLALPTGLFVNTLRARQPRAVAVPTHALRETLQGRLACPVYHLPSGVDLERFCPQPHVGQSLKLPEGERFIFFYGKAQLLRGIDTLLEAFPCVYHAVPQTRLLLLLRPAISTKRILQLIEDHPLREHIRVEVATVADPTPYLASADVVALPFRSPMVLPAQPLTLLEAMAMGKPIVSTSLDVVREFIQDGEEGLLTPPNHPERLAEGIIRILKEPALAKRLGNRARVKIQDEYNWDRIAERTHECYQSSYAMLGEKIEL